MNIQLIHELLFGSYEPRYAGKQEISGATAIMAIPFGTYFRSGLTTPEEYADDPDKANVRIAVITFSRISASGLLAFGAWQTMDLIRDLGGLSCRQSSGTIGAFVPPHLLVQDLARMIRNQTASKRVIIATHPAQAALVAILVRHFGFEACIDPECLHVPWDRTPRPGTFIRQRNPWIYYAWERCYRVYLAWLAFRGLL